MLLASCYSFAQSNIRTKKISIDKDSIKLDTLSIIPGTISVKRANGSNLDSTSYKMDYVNALFIRQDNSIDIISISYKVFPYFFSQKYQHKDVNKIQNNQVGNVYAYSYDKSKDIDFFKTEGLTKSGSLSRGLSFGNNQSVVLNSNLNLQLAGKLSDNIDIKMVATDQNVPIQPEGTTQQLQEFDKIFIQFTIRDLPKFGKTTVTAGDMQLGKPNGYFMNFNKKIQGLGFLTEVTNANHEKLTTTASVGISKGKFSRNVSLESSNGNTFNGTVQEKNQGPYILRGAENEQFIVVLSGTEAIYLNGKLLVRGQGNDYVINYNTSEITFTPQNLITSDMRIVAEFQYSAQNYSRSLIHAGTEYEDKGIKARINIYSEEDNKNKPLQQSLTDPQKQLLGSVGDSVQKAVWPTGDSIPFNNTEVLYRKKDTLNHIIYIYSTDSTKAHFRLSFSYVGINKGNYMPIQSAANGQVYQWIRPDSITNQLKGSYEPVILLAAPKKKQMVSAGADFILSKHSKLSVEGAVSNNDVNTFSTIGKSGDVGYAGKLNFDNGILLSKPHSYFEDDSICIKEEQAKAWKLLTNINYEYVQKNFSAIERFRPVEFERDWNLGTAPLTFDQNIIGGNVSVANKQNIIGYDYKALLGGDSYNGMKNALHTNLGYKGLHFTMDGSYLDSKSTIDATNFLRSTASLSEKINRFTIGIREQQEQNFLRSRTIDSLMTGSYKFLEWEPYAEYQDSSKNKYTIDYKQRTDYADKNSQVRKATYSQSVGGGVELLHNRNSQFRITGSYRRLTIIDTNMTTQKPENTVVGRTEYNFSLLKGFISSNAFYEVGSGLEVKKEFIFLEVAPGQGVYIWVDYNGDGIKQLNEFEISPYPNEANYIKVWIPTDNYIATYTNQFSEVLTIKPAAKWNTKKGIRKIISRFSNQTAYRTDRKTTNGDLSTAYNPFLDDTKDNSLVTLNSSFRNTIYFNQTDPIFGMDFSYQDVRNKTLLENDTSTRENTFGALNVRWNLNRHWSIQDASKEGINQSTSKFFIANNYYILYYETEPKLSFQPSSAFRISVTYKYSQKQNLIIVEPNPQAKSTAQNFGGELKYNALNKGSLIVKANFIQVEYNDAENSPLAFQMLDGLKTGNNYTWSVGYSRTLANNIQLTLSYDGRQSPGIKTIHTGNAQVRAFF